MPSYKWRIVAMLWCISFFNYADRQAIFSVFPLLEREMHLTPVQLGLLGSGFAWVYGLAAPLAGIVVDRARRKTVLLGGLHAWSGSLMWYRATPRTCFCFARRKG
jgi:predicted MFS family arabinose efflux permease